MINHAYLDIGFGGAWKFTGPFPKVPNLESTSVLVTLLDAAVNRYFSDVADMTPVASHQSLNSTLTAASGEDLRYPEGKIINCLPVVAIVSCYEYMLQNLMISHQITTAMPKDVQ